MTQPRSRFTVRVPPRRGPVRLTALALAGATCFAMVACGSSGDDTDGDAGSPTAITEHTSSSAVPGEAVTRTVEHAAGQTEVPADPQRVVVLDAGTTLPTLLDLGVPVVAAPLPAGDDPTDLFPDGALDHVASIGFPEPSPEAVLAAEPDLIVGLDLPDLLDAYDRLSQVAPTVLVEGTLSHWKVQARTLADAVGRADRFDERLDAYEADVADLAAELGDPAAIEVSVIRSLGDQFRIHTEHHFAGQVIDEVGLARPAGHRSGDPDERLTQHSLEQLPLADADVIFVYARGSLGSAGADLDENLADLRSNDLWHNLRAVQADAVHLVDPLAWQQGGLPAARLIVADLRRTLTD